MRDLEVWLAQAREEQPDSPEMAPGVTRAEAEAAAAHAIVVQGGYTTPEIEAERLSADRARVRARELKQLLLDWIGKSLSVISEFGDSSEWPALIEDAQRRARILGISWTPEEMPDYVKDILAIEADDQEGSPHA